MPSLRARRMPLIGPLAKSYCPFLQAGSVRDDLSLQRAQGDGERQAAPGGRNGEEAAATPGMQHGEGERRHAAHGCTHQGMQFIDA